jgi:hypothetical protein
MPSVILVSCEGGDWEAIYVDGVKRSENHSLSADDILSALGIDYKTVELSDEWMDKHQSSFPDNESGLPKSKKKR